MNEEDFIKFVEEQFYKFIKDSENRNIKKFSIYKPILMNKVWVSKPSGKEIIPVVEKGFGLSLLKYFTEKPNYYHVGGIRYAPCNMVVGIQKVVEVPNRVPRTQNLESVFKDMDNHLPPSEGVLVLTTGNDFVIDSPFCLIRSNFHKVTEYAFDLSRGVIDEDILKSAADLKGKPIEEAISQTLILYSKTWGFRI